MNIPILSRGNGQPDISTEKLLSDKLLTLNEFQAQTGSENPALYRTYLVAHGELNSLRNKSGQPEIAHAFGSANSWLYRQNESKLTIVDGAVAELCTHDVPEETAKKILARQAQEHALAAASVVIDMLAHLLPKEAGMDMKSMLTYHTNRAGLVYGPVKDDLLHAVRTRGSDVQLAEVVSGLEQRYGRYRITTRQIEGFYDMFIERLERMAGSNETQGVIDQDVHAYLSPDDREFIRGQYRELTMKAKEKKDDMMKRAEIGDIVATEIKKVRGTLSGPILNFDEALLEPHPSRMLFRIGQTLYAEAYIQDIADEIIRQAAEAKRTGYPNGVSYLALGVNKNLDGRDTASRMLGTDLPTHASIYAKHRGSNIPRMAQVARTLGADGIPNEDLLKSTRFHLNGLGGSVRLLDDTYQKLVDDHNTDYGPFLTLARYMAEELRRFAPLSGIKLIPFTPNASGRENTSGRSIIRSSLEALSGFRRTGT